MRQRQEGRFADSVRVHRTHRARRLSVVVTAGVAIIVAATFVPGRHDDGPSAVVSGSETSAPRQADESLPLVHGGNR